MGFEGRLKQVQALYPNLDLFAKVVADGKLIEEYA